MRSPYQYHIAADAQQPPQQISIPPELISASPWVITAVSLLALFLRNNIENMNKRSQIDNDNAAATNQTVIKQQANLVDDMRQERADMHKERDEARKERERMITAVEHITEVMSEVANALKRVEAILVKFDS